MGQMGNNERYAGGDISYNDYGIFYWITGYRIKVYKVGVTREKPGQEGAKPKDKQPPKISTSLLYGIAVTIYKLR